MDLKPQFDQFLSAIRPSDKESDEMRDAQKELRERIHADETLGKIIVDSFLQGSYRRATATKPHKGKRADVDIVIATTMSEKDYTPSAALNKFAPFLDRFYKGQWALQGRSIGINLSLVSLDLVPTSAPSEVVSKALRSESVISDVPIDQGDWRPSLNWQVQESQLGKSTLIERGAQWQLEPLRIPDRDARIWDDTHPLEQIRWTWEKNRRTGGLYVNVVKAIKWWRRLNPEPKYPKGYPLEHLVGVSCPDAISTVAEGVTLTLEDIVSRYKLNAALGTVPNLPDHGVPQHNVLHRVSPTEFRQFYALVASAAKTARTALDSTSRSESARLWRQLFGDEFPEPPAGDDKGGGGFTPRQGPTIIPPARERWG